jgi:tetratricopeptide (TPR) repeat protein
MRQLLVNFMVIAYLMLPSVALAATVESDLDKGAEFFQKSQYDLAIQELNRALEKNPRFANAYTLRGYCYGAKGGFDQAIADFTRALNINPMMEIAYTGRGVAYAGKGRSAQAIADFTQALQINPRFAQAYYSRGVIYLTRGQFDQAIADFSKILAPNSGLAHAAYHHRAIGYYKKREFAKAWDDVQKAQSLGCKVDPKFLQVLRKASGRQN